MVLKKQFLRVKLDDIYAYKFSCNVIGAFDNGKDINFILERDIKVKVIKKDKLCYIEYNKVENVYIKISIVLRDFNWYFSKEGFTVYVSCDVISNIGYKLLKIMFEDDVKEEDNKKEKDFD